MQLTEYDIAYDGSGFFEFPTNPVGINFSGMSRKKLINLPYKSISPFLNFGTITPKSITLSGTFRGGSRETELEALADKVYSKDMKKFWLTSDKFIFVIGQSLKRSLLGKRTNFIDYVASFETPIPFFYKTSKTYAVTGIDDTATDLNDATTNSTGAFTNAGSAPSHIQHISVTNTSGTQTSIKIGDGAVSGSDAAGDNIITWVGSLTGGEVLHFYLIYQVDNKGSKWYYFKDSADTVTSGTRDLTGDDLEDGPRVTGSTTDQKFSVKTIGTSTPLVNLSFSFYDSYWT